ncbi:SAC3-GANP domain-containing protein [Aphelenchoides besseyi]|nr:SAC3-GANP domain-containing protein [Aphelenchoides besseyi]KAI6235888.1 SAC3-GANP domain-containing protein [Aphelenchoides besseyi]
MEEVDLSGIPFPSATTARGSNTSGNESQQNEYWARAQSNLQQLQATAPPVTAVYPPIPTPGYSLGPPAFYPSSYSAGFGPSQATNSRPSMTAITASHRLAAMKRMREQQFRPPGQSRPNYRSSGNNQAINARPRIAIPQRPQFRAVPPPSVKVPGSEGNFVYSDFFSRMIPENVKDYCDQAYDTLPNPAMKSQLEYYLKERITPLLDSGIAARMNWNAEPMPHKINFEMKNGWVSAAALRGEPPSTQTTTRKRGQEDVSKLEYANVLNNGKRSKLSYSANDNDEVKPVIPIDGGYDRKFDKKKQKKAQGKKLLEYEFDVMGKKDVKKFTNKGIGFVEDEDDEGNEQRKRLRAMRFSEQTGSSSMSNSRAEVQRQFGAKPTISAPMFSGAGSRGNFKSIIAKCSLKRRRRIVGTCEQIEKPYFRLTAEADPSQVRPCHILVKSLERVRQRYQETGDYTSANDQLKSIRQDLITQDIRTAFAISAYECHVLLAIKHKDREEFNQSQQQLKVLYQNLTKSPNRLTFTAYRLLYYVYIEGESDATELLFKFKDEIKKSTELELARKVYLAYTTRDYCTVLRLYKNSSSVFRQVMDFFIERERNRYLQCILAAYRPNLSSTALCEMLHMEKGDLTIYLKKFGISLDDDVLDVRRFSNITISGS